MIFPRACIAVDEAHLIWDWRTSQKEYGNIGNLRVVFARLQTKRQQKAESAPELQVPVTCMPEKHLLFDPPAGTASATIVSYLHNLQVKDIVARPMFLLSVCHHHKKRVGIYSQKPPLAFSCILIQEDTRPTEHHLYGSGNNQTRVQQVRYAASPRGRGGGRA